MPADRYGKNAPQARRMRLLREKLEGESNDAQRRFAARMGIKYKRWNNFENGFPVSIEAAHELVRRIPGLTLDWIYYGRPDLLPLQLRKRLGLID